MKGLAIALAAIAITACKPKATDSETKAIVGLNENGEARALGLLLVYNESTVNLPPSDGKDLGVDYATDLVHMPHFALVETYAAGGMTEEQWMWELEFRSQVGDLQITADRRITVLGQDNKRALAPARVIGSRLLPYSVISEVFERVASSGENLTERNFRLAQAVFLAMRGSYNERTPNVGSPLLAAYMKLGRAQWNVPDNDLEAVQKRLAAWDYDFNPCIQGGKPILPAKTVAWKKQNFSCRKAATSGHLYNYLAGAGRAGGYVEVRNMLAAEIRKVYEDIYPRADVAKTKNLALWDVVTSTASWANGSFPASNVNVARFLAKQKSNLTWNKYFSSSRYGDPVAVNTQKAGASLTDSQEPVGMALTGDAPSFSLGGCGSSQTGQRQQQRPRQDQYQQQQQQNCTLLSRARQQTLPTRSNPQATRGNAPTNPGAGTIRNPEMEALGANVKTAREAGSPGFENGYIAQDNYLVGSPNAGRGAPVFGQGNTNSQGLSPFETQFYQDLASQRPGSNSYKAVGVSQGGGDPYTVYRATNAGGQGFDRYAFYDAPKGSTASDAGSAANNVQIWQAYGKADTAAEMKGLPTGATGQSSFVRMDSPFELARNPVTGQPHLDANGNEIIRQGMLEKVTTMKNGPTQYEMGAAYNNGKPDGSGSLFSPATLKDGRLSITDSNAMNSQRDFYEKAQNGLLSNAGITKDTPGVSDTVQGPPTPQVANAMREFGENKNIFNGLPGVPDSSRSILDFAPASNPQEVPSAPNQTQPLPIAQSGVPEPTTMSGAPVSNPAPEDFRVPEPTTPSGAPVDNPAPEDFVPS